MTQHLWAKTINEAEKKTISRSFFNFRLHLSQAVLYAAAFIFIFNEIHLNSDTQKINLIPTIIILISSAAGLIFSYLKPKNIHLLFYFIPVFCIVATKFIGYDLMQLYGEIFMPYYFIIIALNYLLCSSRIALIYSIFTVLSMYVFYGGDDFAHVFGKHWVAYYVFILMEIVIGYIMLRKYEVKVKKDEIMQETDFQTNLLNNLGLVKELKKAIASEYCFYFILIDIDNLTEISDSIDGAKTDEILKLIAAQIKNIPDGFAFSHVNFGKFIFLSRLKSTLLLTHQLEEFEKSLKVISEKYSLENPISFSSGIVSCPEQSSDISQILNFAEIALEKSKANENEKRCTFFIREYLDDKKRLFAIQKDLLSACRNGELQVHYQPKISLVNKKVTGMEALSRWNHPSIGCIAPEEFVKIAEKSGHILSFGEYVMENALCHISHVHELGLKDITISINVSPLQLLQTGFCENVYAKAQNYGVDPSKIYLEITEGTMLKKESASVLKRLKDMGFNLSLDDFGTGYSSLNYLHQYSFDELKIDKSFTDGLMRGRNERRLFKFLIMLARDLGMKAVTEGVEDDIQIRLLKGLGAEEIQGWYYSKALSSLDCIEYIRNFRFNEANLGSIDLSKTGEFFVNNEPPKTEKIENVQNNIS